MKKLLAVVSALMLTSVVMAGHIAGGELYYQYIGPGASPGTDQFRVTLRLFRECGASGQTTALMPTQVTLGIFRKLSASSYTSYTTLFAVPRTTFTQISVTPGAYPCFNPPPNICYQIGTFERIVDLPKTPFGYMGFWCARKNR